MICFNPRPAPRSRATTCCNKFDGGYRFQSTPGSEEPGDDAQGFVGKLSDWFQSTPGSEEPGDRMWRGQPIGSTLFQSTPGSEEPGDACAVVRHKP